MVVAMKIRISAGLCNENLLISGWLCDNQGSNMLTVGI